MNPVEGQRNDIPLVDTFPHISDIPEELFVAHIFPELTYDAFASSRLVSRQWSILTKRCANSLTNRVIHSNVPLNPSQWRMASHESKELSLLVNRLYAILQQFNIVIFKEGAQVESDIRIVESVVEKISEGMDLTKINAKLVDAFFDSLILCVNNRIFEKHEWQDEFFEILFDDVIGKRGFLYLFAKIEIKWRMQWLEHEADLIGYLTQRAEEGSEEDQMLLGFLFQFGNAELGIERDPLQALHYYHLAANQGDGITQFYLGCCYATGEFVKQDWKKAVLLFYKVARRFNPPFFISAASCSLAYCFAKGKVFPPNLHKAQEFMRYAANQGSSIAKLYLGFCSAAGIGEEQNWKEAIRQFIPLAVAFDNPWAGIALGMCYMRGKGVEQNWLRASQHFLDAYDNWNKGARAVEVDDGYEADDGY